MKMRMLLLLAWRYLMHRKFATFVSILAIALSLVFIVGVGIINFAVKKTAVEGSIRYPLVVGPEGSSGVQLILSTIFSIDKPTGTIPYQVYLDLKKDRRVIGAYPMAVADTFKNIRIIGTDNAFLENLGAGALRGSLDLSEIQNAVFGFTAAQRTGVDVGDTFYGQHGMVGSMGAHTHSEATYRVSGILQPTGGPEDMAIYTSIQAVWQMHGKGEHDDHENDREAENVDGHGHEEATNSDHHKDHYDSDKYSLTDGMLTAVLVRTGNPAFTGMLEREYSLRDGTVAVDTGRSIREFVNHINKGEVFVEAVSAGMLLIALIMILVTLVMSLNERRKELALLRSLGVGRTILSLTIMLESLFLTVFGALAGLVLGHGLAFIFQASIKQFVGVDIEPFTATRMESIGLIATLGAGQVLAGIGMVITYRLDIVEEIARD